MVPKLTALDRLRSLPAELTGRIRGQSQALPRICSVFTRGELGFAAPGRPRGSFLLLGPTGVGKTQTITLASWHLFGAPPLRFDMSEYQLKTSVDKMIGGGSSDGGLLGRAIGTRKQGVLLFDEMEKAHPEILDLFLQMLEDARITLASGHTLDLSGFYPAFTSNLGSAEVMRMVSAPFTTIERTVLSRARQHLRPELFARITEKIVFARLEYPTQRQICEDLVRLETERLRRLGHEVQLAPDAIEFLVREGYHRYLGARPIRDAVERHVQEAVARRVLAGESGSGVLKVIDARDALEFAPANAVAA
jgi:ATP-dependent Clp protease ATP-binding subunit ClpA